MPQTPADSECSECNDDELWEQFVDGRDEALGELYDRHGNPLFHYLLLSTGQPDLAAQHVQSTWALLAAHRAPPGEFGSFKALLYAVATQNAVPPTHPEHLGFTDLLNDFRRRRPDSRRGRLFYRIVDMTRRERQPFLLATVAGLSVPEVARACRFTPRKVRACLARAFHRLGRSSLFRGEGDGT